MRVLFIDTKPNNPKRSDATAVFAALKDSPRVREAIWAEYGDALSKARANDFDAFIAFGGEGADNFVIQNLLGLIPRSAIWFTGGARETRRMSDVASQFDFAFSSDRKRCSDRTFFAAG